MNTTRALTLFLALALLALVIPALSTPTARAAPIILRVTTSGATGGACGASWANPCGLQHALIVALPDDELWVASGTYTPTTDADRFATFQLRPGIAVYGGFSGGEGLRSQRDFTTNVTILSGDIGAPGNTSDNAYHVVTGSWVTYTAVLVGFTVTGGKADGPNPDDRGAGMYSYEGSPTLANVTFSGNSAAYDGGGMHNFYSSPTLTNVTFISNTANTSAGGMYNGYGSPTLTNVTFISNTAASGGGMFNSTSSPTLTDITFVSNFAGWGGGMHNGGSSPTVTNATFVSNTANAYGGGMYNTDSDPTLTNVTFSGNSATNGGGGGIYNTNSSPWVTNVTFAGNAAHLSGGGMANGENSSPTLTNVTLSGNTAGSHGGGMDNWNSNPTIRNTIIWGNTAPTSSQIYNDLSTPSLSDSVVQGGYAGGTHIITADPRLGTLGDYGGATRTIPLLGGSSAINAGNDATCAVADQRGIPRPQGAHCDIGAFESMLAYLPLISR